MKDIQTDDSAGTPEAKGRLREAELIISYVLRGGVIVSAAIILAGMLWFYLQMAVTGHAALAYPRSFGGMFRRLGQGEPLALVTMGLLVLLVTPVLRVVISVVIFALERDWLYTTITLLVLIILLVSLLLGQGGA